MRNLVLNEVHKLIPSPVQLLMIIPNAITINYYAKEWQNNIWVLYLCKYDIDITNHCESKIEKTDSPVERSNRINIIEFCSCLSLMN